MKTYLKTLLLALILSVGTNWAAAQGTAFTYQGQLVTNGVPVTGVYDFTFQLWTESSGGAQVGTTQTEAATGVTNGLFTTSVDFGSQYNGTTYWLQIGVRSNGVGSYLPLSSRQELTPAPYAITAENVDGSVPASQLSGTLPSVLLSGLYSDALTLNNAANSFSGTFAGTHTGNGSGLTNLNASDLSSGTVPLARLPGPVAPGVTWDISGNNTGGFANAVLEIDNNNTSAACAPALRLNATGTDAPYGALSVSVAGPSSGAIATFGNNIAFVSSILIDGTYSSAGNIYSGGNITNSGNIYTAGYLNVGGGITNNGMVQISAGQGIGYHSDVNIGPGAYFGGEEHSINFDDPAGPLGSLIVGYDGTSSYFRIGNLDSDGVHGATSTALWVYGNGDVGIGTTNAQQNLSVNAGLNIDQGNDNGGYLNNGPAGSSYGLSFGSTSGEGIASERVPGGNEFGLDFYTEFINRMAIRQNGLVGINTTNPAAQLDVESTNGIGIQGATASAVTEAFGVYGLVSSTSPGGYSVGVRGQNNGTGGSGIGVWGSQNGSGWGGYFTTVSGIGVLASGGTGTGLSVSGATGISTTGTGSALTIAGGAFHVTGATTNSASGSGTNTTTVAFIEVSNSGNLNGNCVRVYNSLCNGDPNAILIVTPNYTPKGNGNTSWNHTVGTFYDGTGYWNICDEDGVTMAAGNAFNVMVIKN